MRCPNCGTVLERNQRICPACHADVHDVRAADTDESIWCASCGSPISPGSDACPVCGMPIVDSFDIATPTEDVKDAIVRVEPPELVSAIPPEPVSGSDPEEDSQSSSRNTIMIVSVAAAVALMGGLTLFVAKPWAPNPSITHATEDADTSMAGFPGTVQYLRGQDLLVSDDGKEYAPRAEKLVKAFRSQLGSISESAGELERELQEFVDGKKTDGARASQARAIRLRSDFVTLADRVMLLSLSDKDVAKERARLAVLTRYLANELELVDECWTIAATEGDAKKAASDIRGVLARGIEGHGMEEWRKLFVNAYGSEVD